MRARSVPGSAGFAVHAVSMARRYDEFASYKQDEGSSVRGAPAVGSSTARARRSSGPASRCQKQDPKSPIDWRQDAATRPLGAYHRGGHALRHRHARGAQRGRCLVRQCGVTWAGTRVTTSGGSAASGGSLYTKAAADDGGHAFCIVGYDEDGFIILNSWGEWGSHGLAILTCKDWLTTPWTAGVAQLGVPTTLHRELTGRLASLRRRRQESLARGGPRAAQPRDLALVVDMENNGQLSNHGESRTGKADLEAARHRATRRKRAGAGPSRRTSWVDVALYGTAASCPRTPPPTRPRVGSPRSTTRASSHLRDVGDGHLLHLEVASLRPDLRHP